MARAARFPLRTATGEGARADWLPRLVGSLAAERHMLFDVFFVFVLSRLAFALAAAVGIWFLSEPAQGALVHAPVSPALDAFWRGNSLRYYSIASGDVTASSAFFPVFPALLRFLSVLLTGSIDFPKAPIYLQPSYGILIGGVLLSNAAFILAALFFYRLMCLDTDSRGTRRALRYLAFSPFAIYFVLPYPDSLFLAASTGCFLFLRHRRWIWAGVLGLTAVLTNSLGILLVIPFLVELVAAHTQESRLGSRQALRALGGLAMPAAAVVLLALYLRTRTGDLLAVLRVHDDGLHPFAFPWETLAAGVHGLFAPESGITWESYRASLVSGLVFLAFALIVLLSVRSWRVSYSLYALAALVLILSSPLQAPHALDGLGHEALAIFPVFLTLGRLGRNRWADLAILVVSVPLFLLFAALFVRSYPVG